MTESILDLPLDEQPDPDEFIRAAMQWHFNPETGSPYWLERAKSLDFDPRTDVTSFADLTRFPSTTDELRDVRVEDLIPKGYGPTPDIVGVFESGGTTGPPKRVLILRDWWERVGTWISAGLDAHGFPRDVNWLGLVPTGPHVVGGIPRQQTARRGGIKFSIDMDPRWVRKLIAAGKAQEAEDYADHLVDQAAFALRTQDVGVLMTTPPLLERIARQEDLTELVNAKVKGITWGGTHMDGDTRYLFRTEVFPGVKFCGVYGSTMILGGALERPGLGDDDPCVFDPPSPFITFAVVDPETGAGVGYGERGQVVMHHVSRNMLLPNNLERDLATRVQPPAGRWGDSVADVSPVARFGDQAVIEGVY